MPFDGYGPIPSARHPGNQGSSQASLFPAITSGPEDSETRPDFYPENDFITVHENVWTKAELEKWNCPILFYHFGEPVIDLRDVGLSDD